MAVKKTSEQFLMDVQQKYGDRYTILDSYTNSTTKIHIRCNVCNNIFTMLPNSLLSGQGCPKCGILKCKLSKMKTNEQFLIDLYRLILN